MTRAHWIAIGGVGAVLLAAGIGEHLARRSMETRYWQEVQRRQQLEHRVGQALAFHQRLTEELSEERRHSQGLSEELRMARAKMEETVGRLTEENRTVSGLQARLAAMQAHMDQLQGELALALQSRGASSGQVELDRIVVSPADGAALQGRIVSVHPDWNFVVVSLGWDAVKIGEVLSIVRQDQVLAKARVERIQEGACAATILPDWKIANVQVNDVARTL